MPPGSKERHSVNFGAGKWYSNTSDTLDLRRWQSHRRRRQGRMWTDGSVSLSSLQTRLSTSFYVLFIYWLDGDVWRRSRCPPAWAAGLLPLLFSTRGVRRSCVLALPNKTIQRIIGHHFSPPRPRRRATPTSASLSDSHSVGDTCQDPSSSHFLAVSSTFSHFLSAGAYVRRHKINK